MRRTWREGGGGGREGDGWGMRDGDKVERMGECGRNGGMYGWS